MNKKLTGWIACLAGVFCLMACSPAARTLEVTRLGSKTIAVTAVTLTPKPTHQATDTAVPTTPSIKAVGMPFDLCQAQNVGVRYADSGTKHQRATISLNLTSQADGLCEVALFPAVQLLDSGGSPLDYDHRFFKDDASTGSTSWWNPGKRLGS